MEQVVYHVLTQLYTMLLLTQATPLQITPEKVTPAERTDKNRLHRFATKEQHKSQPPHFCGGLNSKLSGYITLRFQILATPLSTAAFATAFATASLTLGSNAAGMM